MNQKKINYHNTRCFLIITLATYLSQALFFVNVAGYLSTLKDPFVQLGNVFLLAMIPFVMSAFFLAPNIDKKSPRKQMLILAPMRMLVLSSLSFGILSGYEPSMLIYISILFYDLGFFLFQSISAKITKTISQTDSLRKTESIGFIGVQLGMFGGGLIASYLVRIWSLGEIFLFAAAIEFLGWVAALTFKENSDEILKKNEQLIMDKKPFSMVLKNTFSSMGTAMALLSFALILPLQQIFNLMIGPWSQIRFHDAGQMLGKLVSGIALGSFVSAMLLIKHARFRNTKFLLFMPILIIVAIAGMYYSHDLLPIIFFAILFGGSFTISRIVIRSFLIDRINIEFVNAISMLGMSVSIIIAIVLILLLTHYVKLKIMNGFLVMTFLAAGQFCFLWLATRYFREIKAIQPAN